MLGKDPLKSLREKYGKRRTINVDAMFFFIYKNDFLQWLAKYESRVLASKNYSVYCYFKDIFDKVMQEMILSFYFKELFPRSPIKEETYKLKYCIDEHTDETHFIGTLQEIKEFVKNQVDTIVINILENCTNF